MEDQVIQRPPGPWNEFPDSYWRAFFGPEHPEYMEELRNLQKGERCSWSYIGFFFGMPWMAYRRMYVVLVAVFIVSLLFGTIVGLLELLFEVEILTGRFGTILERLITGILLGSYANRSYLWHARRAIRAEVAKGISMVEEVMLQRISDIGGVRWWPAVIVLLGALALDIWSRSL